MTQGERVKYIRKENDLTLDKFGERLGVTKTTISRIENGVNNLTDQMIKSICREFNVNFDWLKNETGDPYSNLPKSILEDICSVYNCDEMDRKLIEAYLESSPDVRAAIKQYIKKVMEK